MIRGLNHLTLAVRQLEPALAFYADLLGCRLLARWPKGAYLLAGNLWLALIVDARTHPLPPESTDYTHFAFDVAPGDFDALSLRVRASGVPIWQDNRSEGASLYILDPDGRKLELHASDLLTRLRTAAAAPWPGLEIYLDPAQLEALL